MPLAFKYYLWILQMPCKKKKEAKQKIKNFFKIIA